MRFCPLWRSAFGAEASLGGSSSTPRAVDGSLAHAQQPLLPTAAHVSRRAKGRETAEVMFRNGHVRLLRPPHWRKQVLGQGTVRTDRPQSRPSRCAVLRRGAVGQGQGQGRGRGIPYCTISQPRAHAYFSMDVCGDRSTAPCIGRSGAIRRWR